MKLTRYLFYAVLISALASSCISNKKIVYVQDYDQKKPHLYLADTVFNSPAVDYKIQTGDILYFKSEHPEVSKLFGGMDNAYMAETRVIQAVPVLAGYTVDENGELDLPTIGRVKLDGMTLFEAEKALDAVARTYFENPAIRIFMMNYFVTILGEVNRPGRYEVYNHRMNIFEALGLANDATDYAARSEVKLIRTRNGENHLYHVDLTDQNLLASDAFYIQPNDVILVKPMRRKKYAVRDIQNFYGAITVLISATTLYILITE